MKTYYIADEGEWTGYCALDKNGYVHHQDKNNRRAFLTQKSIDAAHESIKKGYWKRITRDAARAMFGGKKSKQVKDLMNYVVKVDNHTERDLTIDFFKRHTGFQFDIGSNLFGRYVRMNKEKTAIVVSNLYYGQGKAIPFRDMGNIMLEKNVLKKAASKTLFIPWQKPVKYNITYKKADDESECYVISTPIIVTDDLITVYCFSRQGIRSFKRNAITAISEVK